MGLKIDSSSYVLQLVKNVIAEDFTMTHWLQIWPE